MTDFTEQIRQLGYMLVPHGRLFRTRAIYRNGDSLNSLVIDPEKCCFYDFVEGKGGSLLTLIKLTRGEVVDGKEFYTDPIKESSLDERPQSDIPKIYPKYFLDKLIKDHSYWLGRGISETTMERFLGGTVSSGKMAGRYVFPIFDVSGEIIGFSGRAIQVEAKAKWKHIGKTRFWNYPLWLNSNAIANSRRIVLVESIGDCLAAFECGCQSVLVTFGLALQSELLGKVLALNPSLIEICFNNDGLAARGARAAEKLKGRLSKYFSSNKIRVKLPPEKDINDFLLKDKKGCAEWLSKA